jgi:peptidoglycan/xylan/chitin deacetylase (PgdA/CDA1 family)
MTAGSDDGWPDGRRTAVSVTVDLDGTTPALARSHAAANRISLMSWFEYGARRGVHRLSGLLSRLNIQATVYTPGYMAETHPGIVHTLIEHGHEIGHHGYLHKPCSELTVAQQREEFEKGWTALERLGVTPRGYRAPFCELTTDTLGWVAEAGMTFDSSCMGDDRPYWQTVSGRKIVELPVCWALDDAIYPARGFEGGPIMRPAGALLKEVWLREFRAASEEGRHVTLICHPHVSGRPELFSSVSAVLEAMVEAGDVWFAPHSAVAARMARATGPEEV